MEDLNKTQLVLLVLLVSFVTSIATGIITFSLLQEAPTEVTQTINRIVEKTVEKVIPEEGRKDAIREVTVVVSEEDRVIDAVKKNSTSVVRVQYNPGDGTSPFYALGVLISRNGLIVTDRRDVFSPTFSYKVFLADGSVYDSRLKADDQNLRVVFLEIIKEQQTRLPVEPVILFEDELNLGQTVIAISGRENNSVSVGRIASLIFGNFEEKKILELIETESTIKTDANGGPLINLSGNIVGILTSKGDQNTFVSSSAIKGLISRYNL